MLASEIVLNSFSRNNLLSSNHRFRPGDSCINQLLSINKDILSVFRGGYQMGALARNGLTHCHTVELLKR